MPHKYKSSKHHSPVKKEFHTIDGAQERPENVSVPMTKLPPLHVKNDSDDTQSFHQNFSLAEMPVFPRFPAIDTTPVVTASLSYDGNVVDNGAINSRPAEQNTFSPWVVSNETEVLLTEPRGALKLILPRSKASGNSGSLTIAKRISVPEKISEGNHPGTISPETFNLPTSPVTPPSPWQRFTAIFRRIVSKDTENRRPQSPEARSAATPNTPSSPWWRLTTRLQPRTERGVSQDTENPLTELSRAESSGSNKSPPSSEWTPAAIFRRLFSKEPVSVLKNVTITIASKKYGGPRSIMESEWYTDLISEFDQHKVDKLISSYHENNEEFLSNHHIRDVVKHDIELLPSDLIAGESAQEHFLTEKGWTDKLKQYDKTNKTKFFVSTQMATFWKNYKFSPLGEPLKYVDEELKKLTSNEQINLYRTMPYDEAKAILEKRNFDRLKGHLGDFREALSYLHRGDGRKVTLKFPLKPGAHELLFSPRFSAIQPAGKITSIISKVAELNKQGFFPKGSMNEGSAKGYIGIKSEATGDSGISISISDKQSRKLFEKFVDISKIESVASRE